MHMATRTCTGVAKRTYGLWCQFSNCVLRIQPDAPRESPILHLFTSDFHLHSVNITPLARSCAVSFCLQTVSLSEAPERVEDGLEDVRNIAELSYFKQLQ